MRGLHVKIQDGTSAPEGCEGGYPGVDDSWVDGLPPKMVHASCQLLFGRVGRETNQDSASCGFRGKPVHYQVTSERAMPIPPLKWIGGFKVLERGLVGTSRKQSQDKPGIQGVPTIPLTGVGVTRKSWPQI